MKRALRQVLLTAQKKAARVLVLAMIPFAAPVYAQTLGSGADIEIPVVRILSGLALAVLVAIGAVLVLKKRGGGNLDFRNLLSGKIQPANPRRIRVHETHRLSPHADLCRVTVGECEYVLVVSQAGTHVLSVSEEPSSPSGDSAQGVTRS